MKSIKIIKTKKWKMVEHQAKQAIFNDCQEYIDKVAQKVIFLAVSHGIRFDDIKPTWEQIMKKHGVKKHEISKNN